ncbi:MAG: dihydroorotase [Victivallales bacterium]
MNYIFENARVIDPVQNLDTVTDIAVADGKVADPAHVKYAERIDLKGKVLTPGFVDLHVHLRHPGNTAAETIHTGTLAAAAGGFTSIVAMPNTSPCADNPGTIHFVLTHAEHEGVVKVLPCGAMTKNLEGKEMSAIGSLKAAGAVALSDDGRCVQDHQLMRHIVHYSKTFDLPILDHCGDKLLEAEGVMNEGQWSVLLGMKGMPCAAEELMIYRNIILSRLTDWKIHMQHVSAKESVKILRQARKDGIRVSGEATPHHIALTDAEIKRFDSNYKMNPPLRSEEDRQALLEGLADDTLTVIATDHAPHTTTSKMVEFDYAPFGIIGLETAFQICCTELYHKGVLSLPHLISKLTRGPAEVLGLDIGNLKIGNPADITILDIDRENVIDPATFKSKSRNTPFGGYKAKGCVAGTLVNGKFVYKTF